MRKVLAAAVVAAGLTLAPAIDAVHAQGDATTEEEDNGNYGLFGLAGLLGLAGLAGLKRRNVGHDTRRDGVSGSTGAGTVR